MNLKRSGIIFFCFSFVLVLLSSCVPLKTMEEIMSTDKQYMKYNATGLELMEKEEYEEAMVFFYKGVDYIDDHQINPNEKDALFNNLGWAYYELGNYDISLEYIEKALSIKPNDATEYIVKGNTLYGLGNLEEALDSFNTAIENKGNHALAYYGKGLIYFEMESFEDAIKAFNTYLKHEKNDEDAIFYLIYSYLNMDETQYALKAAEDYMKQNRHNYKAYEFKGIVLEWTETYEVVKDYYEEVAIKFPNHIEPKIKLGELDYYYGFYDNARDKFLELIKKEPQNIDLYTWAIYCYSALGELDLALTYYNKALEIDDTPYELHYAMGEAYVSEMLYMEAVDYFNQAIELNPYNEDIYISNMYALFYGKRYSKCIEVGKEYEEIFHYSPTFPWLIAESYYAKGEFEVAIDYYNKALDLDPENELFLSDIAFTYLELDEEDVVKGYIDSILKINPDNETALYLDQVLLERQKPLNERIKTFFSDNYLYYDQSTAFEQKLNALTKENMSNSDIAHAVEALRHPDDLFTFVVYGQDYDMFMGQTEHDVTFKEENNVVYLKLFDFTNNTSNRVVELLDSVKNPENKVLVIDLRDNFGGLTASANDIADLFMTDRVTSTLIDRDGYTFHYESIASHIPFKQIYIFTNENTASAAELLTLTMKTYLDNVTIVGDNTFGKGVGQTVFEDKQEKIAVFVTNHYWNVRQINVTKSPIAPDLYIESVDLKDYMDVVKPSE